MCFGEFDVPVDRHRPLRRPNPRPIVDIAGRLYRSCSEQGHSCSDTGTARPTIINKKGNKNAHIYANENETFNDDNYEYEEIALPFLRDLGLAIYEVALRRDRQHSPDLSRVKLDR